MQRVSLLLSAAPMAAPAPGFSARVAERIARRQAHRQARAGYGLLAFGLVIFLVLPMLYVFGSLTLAGSALARQPDVLGDSLALLVRLANILFGFLQSCWVLVRTILAVAPRGPLMSTILIALMVIAFWIQVVSGRSGLVRSRMHAQSGAELKDKRGFV